MISRSANIIINEIMSSKNTSSIILAESNGENIYFVSTLLNNYKKTFWINADYDIDSDFSHTFAMNIVEDHSFMNKIMQYSYCKTDFSKDIIIVNAVLSYVSKLNCDCLLIIDHLEKLSKDFDMKILETILKNCPKNLKIVLISAKFLELNYNIFDTHSPKLIGKDLLESYSFQSDFFNYDYAEEEWQFLYDISKFTTVDEIFADTLYAKGSDFLKKYSTEYFTLFYQARPGIYYINNKLNKHIESHVYLNERITNSVLDKKLYGYYFTRKSPQYYKALKISLDKNNSEMVNNVVGKIIYEKREIQSLFTFIKRYERIKLSQIENYHIYTEFLIIICDILQNNYDEVINKCNKILPIVEKFSIFEAYLINFVTQAMIGLEKIKEATDFIMAYVKNCFEQIDNNRILNIVPVIENLPDMLRNGNVSLSLSSYKEIEQKILKEEYSDEFWYINIMQAAVACNLDMGYYKYGIEILKRIKELIPFYVVPHELINVYFFAGDMELAQNTANEIIHASKWNHISSNLTDAYVLLGLVSIYYNKITEAVEYLNEAVKMISTDASSMCSAIAIRAMVFAEAGMAEYAKDIALLYARRCEINQNKYANYLYGATAYAYWTLRDKDNALKYAKKCILGATARSVFWLTSTAIMITYLFEGGDIKHVQQLVEKFFLVSRNYGMDLMFMVCNRLFEPILNYALINDIDTDYVKLIYEKIKQRNSVTYSESTVKVKFMGSTGIFISGKELIWKTKKAKELFLLYVLRGEEGIDRNEIIDMFWSDYVYVSAINNLKTNNNLIRNTLQQYKVEFKLEYSNSKYTLHLKNKEVDYEILKELLKNIETESDLRKKSVTVSRILNIYSTGFAPEIKNSYFMELHDKIKEELIVVVMQLIRELSEIGQIMEAKKYISILKKMHINVDYYDLISDINKRFFK